VDTGQVSSPTPPYRRYTQRGTPLGAADAVRRRILRPMTAATKIERSGPAIDAALPELAPDECAEFEVEFRQTLATADTDFDPAPVEAVLDRWWGAAAIAANPLSDHERDQVARARAGSETGWFAHHEHGTRARL